MVTGYGDIANPVYSSYSKDKDKILNFVNKVKDKAVREKQPFEALWTTTISSVLGSSPSNNRGGLFSLIAWLVDPKQEAVKRRGVTANRLFSFYKRALARLTSGNPVFEVSPASDDPEDKKRAELQKHILEYVWQKSVLDMQGVRKEMAFWALTTGTALAKVEWNPTDGIVVDYKSISKLDKSQAKSNLQTLMDDAGNPIPGAQDEITSETVGIDYDGDITIGDISVKVVSPYDFYVPWQYYDLQQAPYCMYYYTSRIEDLMEAYPEAKKLRGRSKIDISKMTPRVNRGLTPYSYFSTSASSAGGIFQDASVDPKNEGIVVVYEVWQRRSKWHPYGRVTVVAEDVILHDGPNPYEHGKYPFVVYREVDIPYRFWGACSLEQCVDLQDSYSKNRNYEIAAAEYTAKPILVTYAGSKVNKKSIVPKPGSVITAFAKGYEPHYLEKGRTEIAAFKNIEASTIEDMQDIMSQHEVSRGITPRNVESGLALSYLAQKDEMAATVSLESMVDAMEKIARMVLQIYAQFADEPRMIKISGDYSETIVEEFVGSDLIGTDPRKDYFDVRIKRSSVAPVNKAALKSEIFAMIQAGLIDPRNATQMRYVRFLWDNVADFEDINLEDRLDEARAKEEIQLILKGEEVVVLPHENHEIHVSVFMRYMKSKEFYSLDKEVQSRLLAHVQIHQDYIAQAYQQMMAGMMEQQGGGDIEKGAFTDMGSRQPGQQKKNIVPPYGMSQS